MLYEYTAYAELTGVICVTSLKQTDVSEARTTSIIRAVALCECVLRPATRYRSCDKSSRISTVLETLSLKHLGSSL
jgi:hypothetical protein